MSLGSKLKAFPSPLEVRSRVGEMYRQLVRSSRVNISLSRAAATSAARTIDATNPRSWEFCGFSQNMEDGIIDYLCRHLLRPNRYFVEIGAGDGHENNSTWLAVALRFNGLMIDGNPESIAQCERLMRELTLGVETRSMFVEPEVCGEIAAIAIHRDPDFLSLDIDGVDYFVMKALFEAGFRPKIVAVEYNSAYGPDRRLSVEYRPGFRYKEIHDSGLYYGVSVAGWRAFFESRGYRFITVDSNGVNAFFVAPDAFDAQFVANVKGATFRENFYQASKFRTSWEQQFPIVQHLAFHAI
jgi:hypothetical protein